MLEALEGRLRRLAELRASRRLDETAERIAAGLPRGIYAARTADSVELSGRGLSRRFALEPALRWLLAGLR
jgi:hypothetical protein